MIQEIREKVQLESILSILGGSMKVLKRLNKGFQKELEERDGIAEIRTVDKSVAIRFNLYKGRLDIKRGSHPCSDYIMVYRDVPTALEILKDGSPEASLKAITEGTLKFEGDLEFGMWFNERLQSLGAILKEPRKIIAR